MADPRDDAITQIRTRLATVPSLWPVAYQGAPTPYVPSPFTPYIAERFAFGEENDAACGFYAGKRIREVEENYQLELRVSPTDDIRTATGMGHSIARTFLDSTITLTGGYPLWFTTYRLLDRGIEAGWQKFVLVLTYRYIFNA